MNDSKRKAEAPISSEKDPERFYCPYPGCNRSFAELWRLKVHYRAPPDIRGSGKERGHGTELTHCPKCGKTLKPGKHHVGCSAGRSAPRQASKRSRVNGEDGDGRSDLSPADSAEPSLSVPSITLPNGLPYTMDNPSPSMSSFSLLPNQYNSSMNFLGFESAASKHAGYNMGLQPDHQFSGYMGQMDNVPPMHPHSHAAQAVHAAQAHAAHALQANSAAAAAAAAAAAGVPNPLLYHHHHHHQLLLATNPYLSLLHPLHSYHGVSPALLHNTPHLPPQMPPLHTPPPPLLPTSAAAAATTSPPAAVSHPPMLNGFEGIFDYNDSLLPERPPSPPPLPADFPGMGGMLFNFKQFARPHSSLLDAHHSDDVLSMHSLQQPAVKHEELTKSKHSSESSADGDLMQILFGLSDDTPSSATINIGNHADVSSKQLVCTHQDTYGLKQSGPSNDVSSTKLSSDACIENDVAELQHIKPSVSIKSDVGPDSPQDVVANGSYLDEPSILPKVDSAAELLRLSDGLNGYVDKTDAGCMSRLLGLDHELFGLLQEECGI